MLLVCSMGASAEVSAVLVFEVQAQNRMPVPSRLRDMNLNLKERRICFFIWEFWWLLYRVVVAAIKFLRSNYLFSLMYAIAAGFKAAFFGFNAAFFTSICLQL